MWAVANVRQAHARLVRQGHVDPVVAVSGPSGTDIAGDPDARFEIGSVTKVFTALLLAQMAQEGLVRLDDPISRYLPVDLRLPAKARDITLEHLACHRSGLPRLPPGLWLTGLSRQALRDPYAGIDAATLHDALTRMRVRGTPGHARYRYSNLGVGVLGHLLGRAAAVGYEQAVLDRVIAPLGLAATSFEDTPLHQGRHRGNPVGPWHLAELAGAGGLHSSARDLLAFMAAQREPPASLAAAVAETHRQRGRAAGLRLGLGWFMLGDGHVLTHDGGTLGARSDVLVDLETGVAVVVLGDGLTGTARAAQAVLRATSPPRRRRS